jgi:ryanodine receptor 2
VDYQPTPIDTTGVELPKTLEMLTEQLAEHTHDVWAQGRKKEGWTYGPKRNDDEKKHPCLVPYADLPEKEKDYDRNTALGTLKAILSLGYEIRKR